MHLDEFIIKLVATQMIEHISHMTYCEHNICYIHTLYTIALDMYWRIDSDHWSVTANKQDYIEYSVTYVIGIQLNVYQ